MGTWTPARPQTLKTIENYRLQQRWLDKTNALRVVHSKVITITSTSTTLFWYNNKDRYQKPVHWQRQCHACIIGWTTIFKKSTRTTKEIGKHIQVVGGPLCPTPPTLERTTCTKICKLGFAARRLKACTNFQTFNVSLSAWKCAFFTRPLVASFMILTSTLFFWSEKSTFWYQTSEWSALFYTVETFVYL